MLELIRLSNFQKHKKLTVKIGPGVTTIIGKSDIGKSAVLRALRMLCLNKPGGASHIHHGAKKSVIGVIFDGVKIQKVRSEKTGYYKIEAQDAMKAVGAGPPPDEVVAVTKMSPLNFQRQGDPPFWFFEPPGQVSRALNEFVSLGSIDKALDLSAKLVRETSQNVKYAERVLAEAEAELAGLQWVEKMVPRARTVGELGKAYTAAQNNAQALASLLGEVKALRREFKRGRAAFRAAAEVRQAGEAVASMAATMAVLRTLLAQAETLTTDTEVLPPESVLQELSAIREAADVANKKRQDLDLLLNTITLQEEELCHAKHHLAELQKAAEKVKPKTCPKCGQSLPSPSPSSAATSTSTTPRRSVVRARTGTG